jgi:two-component system, OmpR family, heavy metal sensor histidine kinase CusS
MINFRSVRIRLGLWYVVFTLVWMICVCLFSYLYLRSALASSRFKTMAKREERFLVFMKDELSGYPGKALAQHIKHFQQANADTDLIQIFDLDNNRVYPAPGTQAAAISWPRENCIHAPCFGYAHMGSHRMRTLTQIIELDNRQVRLCMAGAVDEHYDILDTVLKSYLLAFPPLLLVSILGGYTLSRSALKPVDRIIRIARTLGIQDLQRRLPIPDTGDELQRLAEAWNDLLSRLDSAVGKLTQFTSDISHDLRTSITVILTTAQLALRKDRPEEAYRKSLQTIVQESQETSKLLDDLLATSRTDIAKQNIDHALVDVSQVICEVTEHIKAQAELKSQLLQAHVYNEALVLGDISLLRRLFGILLDNAVKYTPEHGIITASVRTDDAMVLIEVADNGIGIAPEAAEHIFDRFFRVDSARNRDQGGNGLGLAIAKWIVDEHDSTIQVSSASNGGSIFTVRLPQAYVGGEKSGSHLQHSLVI